MPPVVNNEKCIGCGVCVDVCSQDVFFGTGGWGKKKGEKPIVTYPEACWHCYCCVIDCPVEGAIRMEIPLAMWVAYK